MKRGEKYPAAAYIRGIALAAQHAVREVEDGEAYEVEDERGTHRVLLADERVRTTATATCSCLTDGGAGGELLRDCKHIHAVRIAYPLPLSSREAVSSGEVDPAILQRAFEEECAAYADYELHAMHCAAHVEDSLRDAAEAYRKKREAEAEYDLLLAKRGRPEVDSPDADGIGRLCADLAGGFDPTLPERLEEAEAALLAAGRRLRHRIETLTGLPIRYLAPLSLYVDLRGYYAQVTISSEYSVEVAGLDEMYGHN